MDIIILRQVLHLTSSTDEKIEKYIERYSELYSMVVLDSFLKSLKTIDANEEREELVLITNELKELYSGLDIANEEKQQLVLKKVDVCMEKIDSLEDNVVIYKNLESDLAEFDKKIMREIAESVSDEEKQKIISVLSDVNEGR